MADTVAGVNLPSTSTFSFTAPFPPNSGSPSDLVSPHKQQRRVSLALPSSPRLFPAWSFRDDTTVGVTSALVPEKKGKIRRIDTDEDSVGRGSQTLPTSQTFNTPSQINFQPAEKKQRKKWTAEETQMLVDGCNKWGVGNWKAILNDPGLKFDNRSPVDLKDRFRTYFPDAYKLHYPNAKTHLSSKTRSTHPDGTPLFCASRSKKRRPFTPEEDAALKAGYDKHGTVWATIVKDPIFQEQQRRSTDLRDRFRNAWPELYAKAGYKPRASSGKKKRAEAETQEQPLLLDVEPSSKRIERPRAQPMRAATDDQLPTTSGMGGPVRRKRRHTTQGFGLFRSGTVSVPESSVNTEDEESGSEDEFDPSSSSEFTASQPTPNTADVDMDISLDSRGPELVSSSSLSISDSTDSSQSRKPWSSLKTHPWTSSTPSTDTTNPNVTAYAESVAASPTPSSELFLPSPGGPAMGTGMIGKSAWGPQDWLSANPRLEPAAGASFSTNSVFTQSPLTSPQPFSSTQSHPLSFTQLSLNHLALQSSHSHGTAGYSYSHGVLDRYDLFPHSHGHDIDLDFMSEGFEDAHSAFSDPSAWPGTTGMRGGGFTHHSNYAGDLIFGARTHQPSGHSHLEYGSGFGFGLGLDGAQPRSNISSVLHTPALPGIDEIELAGITLDDPLEPNLKQEVGLSTDGSLQPEDLLLRNDPATTASLSPGSAMSDSFLPLALDDIVGIPPPDTPGESHSQRTIEEPADTSSHPTPPATPHSTHTSYRLSGRAYGTTSVHNRSVSVPPTEHRIALPPRTGQSQMVSPKGQYKPLMARQPPIFMASPPTTHSSYAPSLNPPCPSGADMDIPFLDLHYFSSTNDFTSAYHGFAATSRPLNAQALDLAQSTSNTKQLCIPPSLVQLPAGTTTVVATQGPSRMSSTHHRGQSVASVSPQELLLRAGGNDNKRKRASWDGGAR